MIAMVLSTVRYRFISSWYSVFLPYQPMLLHIAAWTPTPKRSLGRRKECQKLQQKFTVAVLLELEGTFANRNFFFNSTSIRESTFTHCSQLDKHMRQCFQTVYHLHNEQILVAVVSWSYTSYYGFYITVPTVLESAIWQIVITFTPIKQWNTLPYCGTSQLKNTVNVDQQAHYQPWNQTLAHGGGGRSGKLAYLKFVEFRWDESNWLMIV